MKQYQVMKKKNTCANCSKSLYTVKGIKYSTAKLCKSCSLIKRWNKPGGMWRNKEWIKKQYFDNKLSFVSIGKIAGCTSKTVEHFFKKFGFTPRYTGATDGERSPNWKGGKVINSQGYVLVFYNKPHAYKNKNYKYVREHVLVMEKVLGRPMKHPEMIHHKNGIPHDNRPENLQLMSGPFEHNTHEQLLGRFAKQILFGDLSPHLKTELQKMFNNFLSSYVNER